MGRAGRGGSGTLDPPTCTLIAPLSIVGLGPAGLVELPAATRAMLSEAPQVIVRTLSHPAAADLAATRSVTSCDDLYESATDFEGVYRAIAERVIAQCEVGPTIYAVPGSPFVGEFAVTELMRLAEERAVAFEVVDAPSFVDAMCGIFGVDPLRDGLVILDGHALPDPLVLAGPAFIAHLNSPAILADVAARLGDIAGEESIVQLVTDAGGSQVEVWMGHPDAIDAGAAGDRVSMFVPGPLGGLGGAIETMRRLRVDCPWDREQTHHSIIPNLIEEAHELADALSRLPPEAPLDAADDVAYAAVEDELGDVLLQILFHVVMAEKEGAIRLDRVAETLRRKLVRRHPHVFGTAEAVHADDVRELWNAAKSDEGPEPESILEDVPTGLPPLARADQVSRRAAAAGFDWRSADDVFAKFDEELAELREAMSAGDPTHVAHELGDLLFTTVNVGRHLGVDAAVALSSAVGRVEDRIRRMEEHGRLSDMGEDELERRWEEAKASE